MLKIKSFPNGIYGATTYLVWDEISKEGVLIDCTCSINEIEKIIEYEEINLKYILITHGHFDHVYCIAQAKEKFPSALILIHKDDIQLLEQVPLQCEMVGIEGIKTPCVDGLIDSESKNFNLGEIKITPIHTKGHSKGGLCYLIGDNLFSGDTLFKESIGRCDLFGGSFEEIEESITTKIYSLDENINVYPGHGEATTIKHEKKYNPYFTV